MTPISPIHLPVEQRITPPGDLAIRIFILAELLVFAIFFASFAFTRSNHVVLFNACQLTPDRNLALLNTLGLVTASYFVVRAVASICEDNLNQCFYWILAALSMGLFLLVIKAFEYMEHYRHGINLRSNLVYVIR